MERLPLDAKLLGNAIIELNIARHILALYPREHQLVQLSLDKTFAILAELFELRTEITLAVAKDSLVVDGHQLDQKNPVYREFALALSRMSVALVSFVKGVTREEVHGFFGFLSRGASDLSSETLPDILTEFGLRHILIEPLDYRVFAFAEDRTCKDGSDRYLLERHLKALLDGHLPAVGAQRLVDEIDPATLAALLNQTGCGLAKETAYDTVVSSYLRSGASRQFSGGDVQRLMSFIAGLRPELKQQFLSSSIRAFAGDTAALKSALEDVPVETILEFFGEIDCNGMVLPESLSTLIAGFAGTGVELPGGGLGVDDVLLSREVAGLFKEEGRQHPPESYRAEIRRILETPGPGPAEPSGWVLGHELEEDYIRYCHANALFALLDCQLPQLIALEDEGSYARSFTELAQRAIDAGQYGQLLEVLTRYDDLENRGRHPGVVRAIRESCQGPEFLAGIVDSIRRHGRADRAGAGAVCALLGARIVPPLFDALAAEQRPHVRKLLLQLLSGLGEHTAREIPARLLDRRWHVRRNALYLLAESGGRCDPRLLARLSRDADPRVRLECARCQIRAGDAAGVATLRALLDETTGGVPEAAAAAAGALGVHELLPELVSLTKKASGPAGSRTRLRAVRALAQIGGEQAADALRGLLRVRFLIPRETERLRGEVRKALLRLEARRGAGTGAAP